MLSSRPKFLLDENVKRKLMQSLKSEGLDVLLCPGGISNGELAALSKSEERVLVTNDSDFVYVSKDDVFSLVLLKIPQNEDDALLREFSKLLAQMPKSAAFRGKLIVLESRGFVVIPLGEKV